MSWKAQKSIERVFSTFKRLKAGIYDKDIEALKELNTALENSQKTYVNDNFLFAKLVCCILKSNLEHYGNMEMAKKNLFDALKCPLNDHIEMLRIALNQNDLNNYFKSIGVDFENVNSENSEIISQNQKQIIEKLNKNWNFEIVEKSLYNTANDLLKDEENYA